MRSWQYAGWIAVGILFSFAFVSILSIGVFVLPFAALTLFLVGRKTRHGADALGVIAGVGATALIVAFINRDNTPCPSTGLSFGSCGGLDPRPWWVAGSILVAIGLAVYAAVRFGTSAFRCRRGTT